MQERTPTSTSELDGAAPFEQVVREAIALSENGRVSLRALLQAWDDRSYGPLFIILGFVGGTPLAIIPGAAAIVGVVIALLAAQMALGKKHPWLPDIALRQSVSEENVIKTYKKIEPALSFIDNLITERLLWAANEATRRIAAVIVFLLGLAMLPFDAVPFAVAAPAWTVVVFGAAITARDGAVMLLAAAAFAGVVYFAVRIF